MTEACCSLDCLLVLGHDTGLSGLTKNARVSRIIKGEGSQIDEI